MISKDNLTTLNPSEDRPRSEKSLTGKLSRSSKELASELLEGLFPSKLCLKEFKSRQASIWKIKISEAEKYNVVKCLRKHKLDAKDRALMVNWMIEVIKAFKRKDQTFFVAIMIMDMFCKESHM